MSGMGQSKAGGTGGGNGSGRDVVTQPSVEGGQGFNHIADPLGAASGESGGLNVVTNPGGPNGMPMQAQGQGSIPNPDSIVAGGKLPLDDLDKSLVKGGAQARVDAGPSVSAPIPNQTSASPAIGAGHKPFRLK